MIVFRRQPRFIILAAAIFLLGMTSFLVARARTTALISRAQKMGRLGNIPPTAQGIRVAESGSLFSNQVYLRFEAPPAAIEQFLQDSPGLMKPLKQHEARTPHDILPAWFHYPASDAIRQGFIPTDSHGNYGSVTVDDARHTVYVYVSHS